MFWASKVGFEVRLQSMETSARLSAVLLLAFICSISFSCAEERGKSLLERSPALGVNYGQMADNLPSPAAAARLVQSTAIGKVKLYGADPAILLAFANTGIGVVVGVANGEIPSLNTLSVAQNWVQRNVVPYVPATNIIGISVGTEVLSTGDKALIAQLLPALQNLHTALVGASLDRQIKVSTAHSLGVLSMSVPPSAGRFRRGFDRVIIAPILDFLRQTGAPFMVNPYPYFGYKSNPSDAVLAYALFQPNPGVRDPNTGLTYTNMFDAQLDAVYSAMKALGYADVDIVAAETGWPSQGDPGELGVSLQNAISYNGNLIKHVTSMAGTPLRPNRYIETYLFSLFNEDLKPGPASERNFGLFKPDLTASYDVGLLQSPSPAGPAPVSPGAPTTVANMWCIPKPGVDTKELQANLDYACGQGIDCSPIQPGGACYLPNTVAAHAAYAMNVFYQRAGRNGWNCDFAQTAALTVTDPSYGSCTFPGH